MELFGIGPLELLFILFIIFIIFGPKDLEKTAKTVGRSLNKLVRSDTWKTLNQTSQKLRTLPNDLIRQAGLEDIEKDLNKEVKDFQNPDRPAAPDPIIATPPDTENKIEPPRPDDDKSKPE
jgi:Sec-independent protein translocase protein TatA